MNYFKIKKSTDGQHYFVLRSKNNKVILTSELYPTKQALQTGIDAVRANAGDRNNFQIRKAENGQPYFVLRAKNHEVIGTSETYSSPQQMEKGMLSVKFHAGMSGITRE